MPSPIFCANYKVYINHTDAGGIVYHANHLTFFENCRRDWLASLGYNGYFFDNDGNSQHQGKIHFVVSSADIRYKLPLFVDDVLVVTIQSVISKSASLVLKQHIYKNQDDFLNNQVASIGLITLACVCNSSDGIKAHRLPKSFMQNPILRIK